MSEPQPVDWTSVKAGSDEKIGGPRHYTQAPSAPVAWRCVACGNENQTPLAQGCPACGSGAPGRHVGVDPVIRPEDRWKQRAAQAKNMTPRTEPLGMAAAYAQWKQDSQLPTLTPSTDNWLWDAFRAGWAAAERNHPAPLLDLDLPALPTTAPADPPVTPVTPPAPEEEPAAPAAGSFPGTARDRTLLAALRFFREQVVPEAAEEIGTGEWLSTADLDQWITQLTEALSAEPEPTGDEYDEHR